LIIGFAQHQNNNNNNNNGAGSNRHWAAAACHVTLPFTIIIIIPFDRRGIVFL